MGDFRLKLRCANRAGGGGGGGGSEGGSYSAAYTVNTTGWLTVPIAAAQGEIPIGTGVSIGGLTTQLDVKNKWSDNSVKFAILTAKLASTGSKTIVSAAITGAPFTPIAPTVSVQFVITAGVGSGSTYTATLPSYSAADKWLDGANVIEWRARAVPQTGGSPHLNLDVLFDVRSFSDGDHRINIQARNARDSADMDSTTYTVKVLVNGSAVATDYIPTGGLSHVHYSFTAWQQVIYVGSGQEATATLDFSKFYSAYLLPKPLAGIINTDYTTDLADTSKFGLGKWGLFNQGILNGQGAAPYLGPFQNVDIQYLANQHASQLAVIKFQAYNAWASWSMIVMSRNDGVSTYKVTDTTEGELYMVPISGFAYPNVLRCPVVATSGGSSKYRGAADDSVTGYERIEDEHIPPVGLVAYFVTGERCFLDVAKQVANVHLFQTFTFPANWPEPATDGSAIRCDRNATGGHGTRITPIADARAIARTFRNIVYAASMCPDSDPDRSYHIACANDTFDWMSLYNTKRVAPGTQWGDGMLWFDSTAAFTRTYDAATGTTVLWTDSGIQVWGNAEMAWNLYWGQLQGIFTISAGALNLAKRFVGLYVASASMPTEIHINESLGAFVMQGPRRPGEVGSLPYDFPATAHEFARQLLSGVTPIQGNDQIYTISVDVATKTLTASVNAFTAGMVNYHVTIWGPYGSNWYEQRYRDFGAGNKQIALPEVYKVVSYISPTQITIDRAPASANETGGTVRFQTLPPLVAGGDGPQARTAIYLGSYWGLANAATAKTACDGVPLGLTNIQPGFGIQIPQS